MVSGGRGGGVPGGRPWIPALLVLCLALGLGEGFLGAAAPFAPAPGSSGAPSVEMVGGARPLVFVENAGQLGDPVAFSVHGQTTTIYFTREGVTLGLRDARNDTPGRWVVKLDFVGSRSEAPAPGPATRTVFNYLTGPRSTWTTGVRTYGSIVYRDVWPGVDLDYTGHVDEVKHSFVVGAGADPSRIRIRARGASATSIAGDGSLVIETPYADIVDAAPHAYQLIAGSRVEVPARFRIQPDPDGGFSDITFELGEYDAALPIVIDPATLVYCGYVGGSSSDRANAIAVDAAGAAYIGGSTASDQTTFPEVVGPDLTYNGQTDAYVAKVTPDGSGLEWAGYIGGAAYDTVLGIAVDASGSAYVAGYTASDQASFPLTIGPGYGGGSYDAFVAKVAADGTSLVYCRYIGGASSDGAYAVDVDTDGHAFVTGYTESYQTSFPVTPGAFRTTQVGMRDAFVAKLEPDGASLAFCTYLGSDRSDSGWGIKVDATGASYVAGYTLSNEFLTEQFPTTAGSFGESHCGADEAFVTKLSADGSSLVYSGLLCGSGTDRAYAIAIDAEGAAYVTGETTSTESSAVPFPLAVGPDLTHAGPTNKADGFVTKVAPDGGSLVYSGYIGGSDTYLESALGIDIDSDLNAYVVGYTWASETTFPVLEGPDLTYNLNQDVFVSRVRSDGSTFDYSGYIGGSTGDWGRGVAVDAAGDAHVAGYTGSTAQMGFPVIVGPSLVHHGNEEAFVAKVTFCGHAMPLTADTWALISLPCDPGTSGNTVADIFGDDGLGIYDTDWAVLERDEDADTYVLLDETDAMVQGSGYWIKVLTGDHTIDTAGSHADSSTDFAAALVDAPSPGRWNMLGHPFAFPVSWADVQVRDDDPPYAVYPLSDAAAGSFIEGRWMYKYNGSAYQTYHPEVGTPTLDRFDGFWVRVLDNATLLIPPTTAAAEGGAAATTDQQWWVRLTATGDGLEDPENYLGRRSAALDGQDEYDLPELEPFAAPFLTVVFPHPEWTGDHWAHTADFRHERSGAGGSWSFEVRTDEAREVTLHWNVGGGDQGVLERSILVDEESGGIVLPALSGSYTTMAAAPAHRFTWTVNSLPLVDAGDERSATGGLTFLVSAGFTDEDPGDSHTATIDWGDGTTDTGVVSANTVSGAHAYPDAGAYDMTVCVEDQLGGLGCDDCLIDVLPVLFADGFESGSTAAWTDG